ncbi:MAG: hypothetical protein EKK55_17315 [Rhodocyclaceae bacterium]|nr:MAG: hypothetical protein EKK55_17315 [Rhodocyclaceae bacterium]
METQPESGADGSPGKKEESKTIGLCVGDKISIGGAKFFVASFGRSAVVLQAESGTHIVERK